MASPSGVASRIGSNTTTPTDATASAATTPSSHSECRNCSIGHGPAGPSRRSWPGRTRARRRRPATGTGLVQLRDVDGVQDLGRRPAGQADADQRQGARCADQRGRRDAPAGRDQDQPVVHPVVEEAGRRVAAEPHPVWAPNPSRPTTATTRLMRAPDSGSFGWARSFSMTWAAVMRAPSLERPRWLSVPRACFGHLKGHMIEHVPMPHAGDRGSGFGQDPVSVPGQARLELAGRPADRVSPRASRGPPRRPASHDPPTISTSPAIVAEVILAAQGNAVDHRETGAM